MKYAQEIQQKTFRGGKLPVQSPGQEMRWVPLAIEKLPAGYEGMYDAAKDAIFIDPSMVGKDSWNVMGAISHEGIHAFDPSTRIASVRQKYASKISTTAKPGTPGYNQIPVEFTAKGGGDLEHAMKSMASSSEISLQQKLKNIDELENWLRVGIEPPSQFGKYFSGWVSYMWKNNPKLWRQFKEKFYTTLERIRGQLNGQPTE